MDLCSAPAGIRRRSEEELRGGEAHDNMHRSAAERTLPQRVNGQRGGRGGACCWLIELLEQSGTKRKEFCSLPIGEEAEVADEHKAARQQVQEEAAQELIDGQSQEPLLVAVSGVSPAEGDVSVGESNQPVIGDGNAVGVGAEMSQHMFWPTEGGLE